MGKAFKLGDRFSCVRGANLGRFGRGGRAKQKNCPRGRAFQTERPDPCTRNTTLDTLDVEVVLNKSLAHVGGAFKPGGSLPLRVQREPWTL